MRGFSEIPPDLRVQSLWQSEDKSWAFASRVPPFADLKYDDEVSSMMRLVLALAAWDDMFRARGLIDGNVYLASEASVPALASVAGILDRHLTERTSIVRILDTLFHSELVYRFPVALKFRAEFGNDRQFRLNCWGRRLAERLGTSVQGSGLSIEVRRRVDCHLRAHEEQYRVHMAIVLGLDEHAPGAAWDSACLLPVGVLA